MQLDQNGFQPQDIELKPAQGVVFHISNTQARIVIELVEPDDGPAQSQGQATLTTPPGAARHLPDFTWVKPGALEPPGG